MVLLLSQTATVGDGGAAPEKVFLDGFFIYFFFFIYAGKFIASRFNYVAVARRYIL